MDSMYNVKTEVFEGPLDALLGMIEKRKLLINDISLATVAQDYIEYVKTLEHFPLADSAQFILVASTLVLIKSKSLLPTLDLSSEEETQVDDLEKRLSLHQQYKILARSLGFVFGKHILFQKTPNQIKHIYFVPDTRITKEHMLHYVTLTIAQLPKKEHVPHATVKKVMSIEEAIVSLTDRITKNFKMSFRNYAGVGKKEKVEVIVNFLALLELVKQGIIAVKQDRAFQDIEMETNTIAVPRY